MLQLPSIYQLIKLNQFFRNICFRLAYGCIVWSRYRICICKSAAVIAGLLFGQKLVNDVVIGLLVTYLTDSWETDNILIKSVTIVNSQKGLSSILMIIAVFLLDTRIGRLKPIHCLSTIYIFALVVLTVLSFISQGEFGTENIIAVILLATGKAIVRPAEMLMSDQLRFHEPKFNIDENRIEARRNLWSFAAELLVAVLVILISGTGCLNTWPAIFAFSTSIMAMAFLLFLYGTRFYHCKEPTSGGSPFGHIICVVMAAFRKRFLVYPDSSNQLTVRNDELDQLRKDLKLLLRMLPLGTTFLGFGLGLATADTLFPEQGNNMMGIPLLMLLVLKNLSGTIISLLYYFIVSKWMPHTKTKCCHLVRIWLGMLSSVICFMVAWRVELLIRLATIRDVRDNGLQDDEPRQTIPMSTWWLAPQFCIFGLMKTLAVDGLDDFFCEQISANSLVKYGSAFTEFFVGTGNFISVICVHALKTCFGQTLNRSRLDKYYMMMAIICFANLCFYSWVSTHYWQKNLQGEEEQKAEPSNPDVLAEPPVNIVLEVNADIEVEETMDQPN